MTVDPGPIFGIDDSGPTFGFKIETRQIRWNGWRRDIPDHRDLIYQPSRSAGKTPNSVDLQDRCPPIYNQGALGSCTAQAVAGAVQFVRMREGQGDAVDTPSRLFIYFGERVIERTVKQDSGASLRDGIKVVATDGACFENGKGAWPYRISRFAQRPPEASFKAAKRDRALQYQRLELNNAPFEACLAEGFPFVFGFSVFKALQSKAVAKSGVLSMPNPGERPLGGHAVMAVGYDRKKKLFKIRNSWGAKWGQDGYFWMPYEYLTSPKYSSDFWTIRLVSRSRGTAAASR